jgi:hypothetical protein
LDTQIIHTDNLLGKLIDNEYKKYVNKINLELQETLNQYEYKTVEVKHGGNNRSYPVGSVGYFTRIIGKENTKVYLIAITYIDDSKSPIFFESKKDYFVLALNNLWERIRYETDNKNLSIPIIGTGISQSNNSKYLAILDICNSFINASANKKVINNLEIIIYKNELPVNLFNILKKTLPELVK